MSWIDDEQSQAAEEKYLRLPDPDQGKTTELKVRVLDERPAKVFRHWIGADPSTRRPFNCPSKSAGCPACAERQTIKDKGEDHRDVHRMDRRYLVNVLVLGADPYTRIFSFGQKLGEKLDFLHDRYGDLRDYDITVIKRKNGPAKWNVEYDAIYEDKRDLNATEKEVSKKLFDLAEEVKPSSNEDIRTAMQGKTQTGEELASAEQMTELKKLLKKKGFELADVEIHDPERVSASRAAKIIQELS